MSELPPLHVERLRIRRAPGIPDGFDVGELSPGVTLIFGPNASGKTTTVRAIEAVLWPADSEGCGLSAVAEYVVGDARFRSEVDGPYAAVQRDGREMDLASLPVPTLRSRYRLSLDDLMAGAGEEFAAEIARQSAGGIDFATAAEELEYREPSSRSGRSELQDLRAATEKVRACVAAQETLAEEARRLADLGQELTAARTAAVRERMLAIAVRHAKAVGDDRAAAEALGAFPEVMVRLDGSEGDTLRELDDQMRIADIEADGVRADLNVAHAEAERLCPGGVPDGARVERLRAAATDAEQAERRVAECETQAGGAAAALTETRGAIGSTVQDEQLARVDAGSFGEFAEFARQEERAHARLTAALAELHAIGDVAAPEALAPLHTGVSLLTGWLAETRSRMRGSRRATICLWIASALAAVAFVLLALRWHWAFALVALGAIALALVGTWPDAPADQRASRERDFAALGLRDSIRWNDADVRRSIEELQGRIAACRLEEARAARRAAAAERQADAQRAVDALQPTRASLIERLGAAPDTEAAQLSWLADRIGRWRDALAELRRREGQLEAARRQQSQVLTAAAELLVGLGYDSPVVAADVRAACSDLESRLRDHAGVAAHLSALRERLDGYERTRIEREGRRSAILARAEGLDASGLTSLCAQFGEFTAARQRAAEAARDLRLARSDLEAAAGFDASLLDAPVEMLETERSAARAIAARNEELVARISSLETTISSASKGHELEDALAAERSAAEALRLAREHEIRSGVGLALLNHVRDLTRDVERPKVFHRARELFARVTRGRARLEMGDGDQPEFRARDSETDALMSLEQLSSATRVQLLLAVRVAFVETQEQGARLPLLLDEALGTSDDQRSAAIIDAVIELSRAGRQVFYFTAQRGEVAAWRSRLAGTDVPHQIVNLAGARRLPVALLDTQLPEPLGLSRVPDVDGCTHVQYGERLDVPEFVPGVTPASAASLWYVVDDPVALRELLVSGVATVGALEAIVQAGGVPFAASSSLSARASALGRALAALTDSARVGRGKPVGRTALAASAAISDRFMKRVTALAEECGGRASELVQRLADGDLKGFREAKVAELRDSLERDGYLDAREPLRADEIRDRMLQALGGGMRAGVAHPGDVDLLLARVATRRRAVPEAQGTRPPPLATA